MNEVSWRRYISLFTTEPINVDASKLVGLLEKEFSASGFKQPYNTETNAPDNKDGAPALKIETSDSRNGIWIGNHLIFMPVGDKQDKNRLTQILSASELSSLRASSYSLNSISYTSMDEADARKSTNPEITSLLNDPNAQEFSKNVTTQLPTGLTAKSTITVSRGDTEKLIVEMRIEIDSKDTASGQNVSELVSQIDFEVLEAQENATRERAEDILIR